MSESEYQKTISAPPILVQRADELPFLNPVPVHKDNQLSGTMPVSAVAVIQQQFAYHPQSADSVSTFSPLDSDHPHIPTLYSISQNRIIYHKGDWSGPLRRLSCMPEDNEILKVESVNWAGWNHPMWWVLHCINEGNPFLLLECTSCVLSTSAKDFITEAIHKCCRMLASFGLITMGWNTFSSPTMLPEKASFTAQIVKEWLHHIHDMSGVWWELQLAQARKLVRERNATMWISGQNLPTCTTLALLLSGEVMLGDDGWPVFYRPSFGTIHAPHMDIVLTDGEDEQVRKTFNLPKGTVEELERMGRQRGSDLSAVVREILFQAVCDDRERLLRLSAKQIGSRWEVGGIKPIPKGMVPGACASEERTLVLSGVEALPEEVKTGWPGYLFQP